MSGQRRRLLGTKGGGREGITIRRFGKLGWQVWFDGASASGYFDTPELASEEAKLVETEVRLGGVKHDRQPAQFRFSPSETRYNKGSSWLPNKRKKGRDVHDEGPEDL